MVHLSNVQIFGRYFLLQCSGILCKKTKKAESPTTASFISSFQFWSKTQVANKSASCLAAGTDFLVTVCKYSEVACIKAATHKEFPPKKRKEKKKKEGWWLGGSGGVSPWISASEQKWLPCITRMGASVLESCSLFYDSAPDWCLFFIIIILLHHTDSIVSLH